MQKKEQWLKPELIVLVRDSGAGAQRILSSCKQTSGAPVGPNTWQYGGACISFGGCQSGQCIGTNIPAHLDKCQPCPPRPPAQTGSHQYCNNCYYPTPS